jgi:hypothetical protein
MDRDFKKERVSHWDRMTAAPRNIVRRKGGIKYPVEPEHDRRRRDYFGRKPPAITLPHLTCLEKPLEDE